MSKISKYGKCIEQFDVVVRTKSLGLLLAYLITVVYVLDGGLRLGPYSSIVVGLALIGVVIFAATPNCPGSTSLRACEKGFVFRMGFVSPLFLRWDKIDGIATKEKKDGDRLLLTIDESVGIGKQWEFSRELSLPADVVAARLTEIRDTQRREMANSTKP